MLRRWTLALSLAALTACAGPGGSLRDAGPGSLTLARFQARLAARARSHLGETGPFQVGAERFAGDCSGFVEAVYEAEGVPLRRLMRAAAPAARSGVAAAWETVGRYGERLPPGAWPVPGDLVFWNDTWDRDADGRRGDRLTHMGVVQWVEQDTIVFVHRGSKGVVTGAMTVVHPGEARAEGGAVLNTPLRRAAKNAGPVLAGELLAGYGRIDPERLPAPSGGR